MQINRKKDRVNTDLFLGCVKDFGLYKKLLKSAGKKDETQVNHE